MRQSYFIIGLVIISGIYLTTRLFRLESLMTFHLDQGQYMLETFEMWKDKKIRLIGPPMITRSYQGRYFFVGPYFYYILAVLGWLTKWEPLAITAVILLIEWVFLIIFVWWLKERYGGLAALGVFLTVATNKFLIMHSRFIWNPHFLLPLGVLGVIFLDKYKEGGKRKDLLVFGLLWGLAFSFHQTAVLWLIPLLIVLRKKLFIFTNIFIFGIAFILGDILYFIFEIKHNLYNIRTMWLILTQSSSKGRLEPHHIVFPLIIFGLWGVAYLIKRNKKILAVVMLINFGLAFLIKDKLPLGHPEGWTYKEEKEVVRLILEKGCPNNYNIASTLTTNTISYDLRYLLTVAGCPPMGIEEYPKAEKLYLISSPERPAEREKVWEVESFRPFKIMDKQMINNRVVYYELADVFLL